MSADNPEVTKRLEFALEVTREAGWITLEHFRSDDLRVDRKADDSPVTIADRRAEEHLRHRIAEAFPDDGIIGEELPEVAGASSYRWILDPIDGTKSFIHAVPLYTTLVAVEREGEPLLGVILAPATDECVYAAIGQGAWYVHGKLPPKPAKANDRGPVSECLFVTSEVSYFDEISRRDVYQKLEATARLTRSWGDAYGYLMVATGRAEVMVDPVVSLWDLAALLPVVEEAGGKFTDWEGKRTIHSGQSVATNGRVHDEVLAVLMG